MEHTDKADQSAGSEIPERKIFLSRKTSFPIFTGGVADGWLQLLNLTYRIGTDKRSSDGERCAEALNTFVTIEPPLLEDGERDHSDDFAEYLDFSGDDFERVHLPSFMSRFTERAGATQIEAVYSALTHSADSRSAIVVLPDCGSTKRADSPQNCISASFNVIDGKLFGSFVLRECDVYSEWPIEALALVHLLRETAGRLQLEVGTSTFVIHSPYLCDRDWQRALLLLENHFQRPLPLHVDPSGVFLFGNDGGEARAMLLNHDASKIQWEQAFSDPEDLSWYIVDVMPWLSPQHIRYVGQECASLMRAMREKECYLQG
jgi:hypothetical protein